MAGEDLFRVVVIALGGVSCAIALGTHTCSYVERADLN
jgi:hypothetical protein